MTRPFRIATRGSALALAQANLVLGHCRAAFPDMTFELNIIKTTGDKLQTASLSAPELPKGLFTKEIEEALLSGEADLAVHSLKDLPTELPPGLTLGAVGERADPRDVLIYRDAGGPTTSCHPPRRFASGLTLAWLPHAAIVATSSHRRRALLLDRRPDLQVVPIRGNVGTRLRKLADQPGLDALILAAAGLIRLGFWSAGEPSLHSDDVPSGLLVTPLSPEEMPPCVGQAALGLEVREGDTRAARICATLDHAATHACVAAERAFLRAMGGGCHTALAAHAETRNGSLRLRVVSFLDLKPRHGEIVGPPREAELLGERLAAQLRSS